METPICIADTQTLIDHIHEVKSWIYAGDLCLVVLSNTLVAIDQICQSASEAKPATPDQTRSKVPGKPARKEYPSFDTNPRIAKAFLQRVKNSQTDHQESAGRPIFKEVERHDAVHITLENEQYSPWKGLEEVEARPETPPDRPSTWAEKLKKKRNVQNDTVDGEDLKGPAKPKLVAKSGSENYPWKIQKSAPSTPATDVPVSIRSLMSFILWRTHESVHRNDSNQIFVLTARPNIAEAARSLHIVARSPAELARLIASKHKPPDPDALGDVEKEFGLCKPIERVPSRPVQKHRSQPNINGSQESPRKDMKPEHTVSANDGTTGTFIEEAPLMPESLASKAVNARQSLPICGLHDAPQREPEDGEHGKPISTPDSVARSGDDHPPSKEGHLAEPAADGLLNAIDEATALPPEKRVIRTSTTNVAPGFETKTSDQPCDVEPQPLDKLVGSTEAGLDKFAPKETSTSEEVVQPLSEQDSDEEVVVFQPKRLSSQKAPSKDSRPSTPITPAVSEAKSLHPQHATKSDNTPKAKPIPRSPRNAPIRPKPPPQSHTGHPIVIDPDAFGRDFAVNPNSAPRNSKQANRARHSPHASLHTPPSANQRPSSLHLRQQSPESSSPTALAPHRMSASLELDSSASSSIVLPQPIGSELTSHSPESTKSDSGFRGLNANAPVFQPGASIDAQILGPIGTSPLGPTSQESAAAKLAPIGSGRPSSKKGIQPNRFGLDSRSASEGNLTRMVGPEMHAHAQTSSNKKSSSSASTAQNTGTVGTQQPSAPGPAARPEQKAASRALSTSIKHDANRKPESPNAPGQPRTRPERPARPQKKTLYEPTTNHAHAHETERFEARKSVVPDVQYVLKSGSTREQARGKGKLWTG